MIRRLSLLAACLLAVAAAPARADWKFAIPDGWTDLSPGKPAPKDLPEEVADEITTIAQSGTYHTYAMDLRNRKRGGFAQNLNAIVQQRPLVADQRALEQWAASVPAQAAQEIAGGTGKVVEQSIVPVAGVPSLRLVVDIESTDAKMRSLVYMIPGGRSTAQVTYSSAPDDFAKALPLFESTVRKTEGAALAPVTAQIGSKLLQTGVSADDWRKIFGLGGKLIGGGIGILVALYFANRSKRKKAAAAAAG